MNFVVDASVAIKWFVREELRDVARSLSQYRDLLHAPDFIVVEMANVAWKKMIRGEIERHQAGGIVSGVQDGSLRFYSSILLNDRALEIALDLKHSVYDCLYIACAEEVGEACVVTADSRLHAAVADTPYAGLVAHLSDITS